MLFNPFPNKPWFLRVCITSQLKTMGKGEIARYEQFLLFPQCFLPFWRTCCHFHQIKNCYLQTLSVSKLLKFVVWESVKAVFNSISIILRWPVHLSMLSWSSFNQYSAQYSFQATACFIT